jgi:hypothetical protein
MIDCLSWHSEHDRDRLSSRFRNLRRRIAPARDEYGDPSAYQISCVW